MCDGQTTKPGNVKVKKFYWSQKKRSAKVFGESNPLGKVIVIIIRNISIIKVTIFTGPKTNQDQGKRYESGAKGK